jgi:HNH endonuclease
MSITNIIEDIVIARWAPGEWLTIDDVVSIALEPGITEARSTIQRTLQELRDRHVLKFTYDRGYYQRVNTNDESNDAVESELLAAQRLRDRRFALRPGLQALVDTQIRRLASKFSQQRATTFRDIPDIITRPENCRTEAAIQVMTRLGQGQFRENLISYWRTCAVTGCDLLPVLRASHIKPWRLSNDVERLDVYNGLLLVPHLDVLFDAGLITFDDDGAMKVSGIIRDDHRRLFRIPSRKKIAITDQHTPYLSFHRKNIFMPARTEGH